MLGHDLVDLGKMRSLGNKDAVFGGIFVPLLCGLGFRHNRRYWLCIITDASATTYGMIGHVYDACDDVDEVLDVWCVCMCVFKRLRITPSLVHNGVANTQR